MNKRDAHKGDIYRSPIAVVIGIGSYNDLGIIRSCGERGVRSIYISSSIGNPIPIHKSKYLLNTIFDQINEENLLEHIKNISQKFSDSQIFIFPASDNAVEICDKNYNKLPKNIISSHAYGGLIHLMDKNVMTSMAFKAGLTVPKTFELKKSDTLNNSNFPENFNFPLIIKPVNSIKGSKNDIQICKEFESLKENCDRLFEKGYKSVLIQEYIHNSSSREIGITGISYPDGTVEIHGWIEKYRNRSNINNFGEYFPYQKIDCLKELTEYIKSTKYIGIFDTDFILKDGKLYFIECNFRNGAYGYAVTTSGFNMPYNWISNYKNENKKKNAILKPILFMEERTDVLNVLDKTMKPIHWLKDCMRTNTFLWWNWKDPKPLLRIPVFIKDKFRKN